MFPPVDTMDQYEMGLTAWTSRENSLELIEISSINKVILV